MAVATNSVVNKMDVFVNGKHDFSVSLAEILQSFSKALDLMNPSLAGHHVQTCFVACKLADGLGIAPKDKDRIFSASIIHDVGAIAIRNVKSTLEFEEGDPHLHATLGAALLQTFKPFHSFAEIVRHHHVKWQNGAGAFHGGQPVSELSHILHLADRVAIMVHQAKGDIRKVERIRDKIKRNSGTHFVPGHVDCFMSISSCEAFWLDLISDSLFRVVLDMSEMPLIQVGYSDLASMAKFFSRVIDTRSRFTSMHSGGVAGCAERAAIIAGLPKSTANGLLVAGYLHDVGKLAVPIEIIEKSGPLTKDERAIINTHTYYTKRVLEGIGVFSQISQWAANHHERLDGSGYPFHLKGDEFDFESQLVAVSDIFTALCEVRPYRDNMPKDKVLRILLDQVKDGYIGKRAVEIFCDNFDELDQVRNKAQEQEIADLRGFWETASTEKNLTLVH